MIITFSFPCCPEQLGYDIDGEFPLFSTRTKKGLSLGAHSIWPRNAISGIHRNAHLFFLHFQGPRGSTHSEALCWCFCWYFQSIIYCFLLQKKSVSEFLFTLNLPLWGTEAAIGRWSCLEMTFTLHANMSSAEEEVNFWFVAKRWNSLCQKSLFMFRMSDNWLQEEVFQIVLKIDDVKVVILCPSCHVEEICKLKQKQGRSTVVLRHHVNSCHDKLATVMELTSLCFCR